MRMRMRMRRQMPTPTPTRRPSDDALLPDRTLGSHLAFRTESTILSMSDCPMSGQRYRYYRLVDQDDQHIPSLPTLMPSDTGDALDGI